MNNLFFLVIISTFLLDQCFSYVHLSKTFRKVSNLHSQVQVEFLPSNKLIMANIGTPLSEVAAAAEVPINYKCKKGECGTCQVQVDGKWIKTCQTKVPSLPNGVNYSVTVKPFKEKAKFFSPQSLLDGFTNNALGMVGFVSEAANVDDEFNARMEREKKLAEKVEAAKKAKKANK